MQYLFHLDDDSEYSLQTQIVEQIATAIAGGHIPADVPLPSSRSLAKQLGVGRNTVTLAYNRLRDDGLLVSKERSGYFVNVQDTSIDVGVRKARKSKPDAEQPNWSEMLQVRPTRQRNIEKPADWQNYQYRFNCGQLDLGLFPVNHWRECCRDAMSVQSIHSWMNDRVDADDPLLLDQIHQHLLPRRGILAEPEQILVTVGAQHALYMIARLFFSGDKVLGLEDPGYVDMRNIAELNPVAIRKLPVDDQGLIISDDVFGCDCVYITPSHQSPTTVTLPLHRRLSLLAGACSDDFFIIEDDYECEMAYSADPIPALKSLDENERVIYVGSLSKTLAPGLRLGFIVAATPIIRELRALRRLMLRHPPMNNQRSVALFLARGHHESLIRNLRNVYQKRCQAMSHALDEYFPGCAQAPAFGGSSFWVKGPEGLDARQLQRDAALAGILIESGHLHFLSDNPPLNFFRLGFSSISADKIRPGIEKLASL